MTTVDNFIGLENHDDAKFLLWFTQVHAALQRAEADYKKGKHKTASIGLVAAFQAITKNMQKVFAFAEDNPHRWPPR